MFLKYNWKALLWAFFILVLCGIPGSDLPQFNWLDILSIDKLAHASVFCVLVILGSRGVAKQFAAQNKRSNEVLPALLFGLLYSPLTELLQDLVFVERTAELLDMIANWMGCFARVWLYRRYFAIRPGGEHR